MDRSHLALQSGESSGKVMFQATLGPSSNQELFHKGLKMLRVGEEIMQVTPPKKVFGEGHGTWLRKRYLEKMVNMATHNDR